MGENGVRNPLTGSQNLSVIPLRVSQSHSATTRILGIFMPPVEDRGQNRKQPPARHKENAVSM